VTLQPRIPAYIIVGRVVAIVGLSLAIALGIFILLAGRIGLGALTLAAAVPFGALIFLIERAPGGASSGSANSGPRTG
jgi:uncharacterized RDD family membrane protein YckC